MDPIFNISDPIQGLHQYPVIGTVPVEVLINTSGKVSYDLPHDDLLHRARIIGIVARVNNANGDAYSKNGNPLIAEDALQSCFLTLRQGNNEVWQKFPVTFFLDSNLDGPYMPTNLECLDLTRSKIEFMDPAVWTASKLTVGEAFVIHFIYDQLKEEK